MGNESGRRGCFKTSCIGCLIVAGAGMIVVLVIAVLAVLQATRERQMESVDVVRGVPSPQEIPPDAGAPGRVVLDVSWGSFSVRRGAPGEPLRLDGRYDAAGFELEETYDTEGERGWTYRVRFAPRGMRLMFNDEDSPNRLRLTLPADMPISLEGRLGTGESDLSLGGLWLVDLDLEVGIGQHRIGFDEPLHSPMNTFRLDASLGDLRVESLGHASPASVEIDHGIGDFFLSLGGDWRRDAEITIRCGVGECDIRVPRAVGVELETASMLIGELDSSELRDWPTTVPGAPTLHLSVSGQVGEVHIGP